MLRMNGRIAHCGDALEGFALLGNGFLPSDAALQDVTPMNPSDLPPAHRRLLVHHEHMTLKLQEHFGEAVELRILASSAVHDIYSRMILLELADSGVVVEIGIARIELSQVASEAREEILSGQTPLGDILIRHDVLRRIEPRWYVRVGPKNPLTRYLPASTSYPAYGRLGVIECEGEPAIELLEVVANVGKSE